MRSNFKNEDIFKVYVALNSFIYVRPVHIDENNDKCLLFQENVATMIELTKVLLLHDLPLETEWKFTFSTWLSALIDAVLSKLETEITSQLLNLLKNLLAFSPILVEENVKKLTKSVMLSKKCGQDVVRAHSDFCLYILSVHVKLNRIHKLISAVLITIKENLPNFEIENIPNKFDVFPTEVFNCIQTAVTNLPSTVQNVALLNTLFFHLENDCIVTLERDTSKEVGKNFFFVPLVSVNVDYISKMSSNLKNVNNLFFILKGVLKIHSLCLNFCGRKKFHLKFVRLVIRINFCFKCEFNKWYCSKTYFSHMNENCLQILVGYCCMTSYAS